jgi:uncharacterized protein (TIGR02996 family)
MDEQDALIGAILAAPDDDLPRLVYADWLQERGGVRNSIRAKLIRAQCELARMAFDDPGRERLEVQCGQYHARTAHWLQADHPNFLAAVRDLHGHIRLERGMPVAFIQPNFRSERQVWGEPSLPLPDLPAGFTFEISLIDWHRSVMTVREWLRAVAATPAANLVTTLSVVRHAAPDEPLNGDAVRWLLADNPFARLESLTLAYYGLTDDDIRPLASGHKFWSLRRLALDGNALSADGLNALATGRLAAHLRGVSLFHNPAGCDAELLAAWLRLP